MHLLSKDNFWIKNIYGNARINYGVEKEIAKFVRYIGPSFCLALFRVYILAPFLTPFSFTFFILILVLKKKG